MNPPTEQLVRDYLNRLSLAARSRLGLSDRQALLDQTRARIEAEVGGLNHATPAQVRQTLAALGDPIALVENERTRIAARAEAAISSRIGGVASGAVRHVWPRGTGVAQSSVRAGVGAGSGSEPAFDLQVPGRLPATGGMPVPALVTFSEFPAAGAASPAVPAPPVGSSISIGLPALPPARLSSCGQRVGPPPRSGHQ